MFTPILLALGGAFVTGAAVGYLVTLRQARHDLKRLRDRYRALRNDFARLEQELPQFATLRVLPGGRR